VSGANVVGSAYVELRPATDGFEQEAGRALDGPAQRLGRRLGLQTGTAMGQGLTQAAPQLEVSTEQIASRLGNRFGTAIGKGIGSAFAHPGVTAAVGGGALLVQKIAEDQLQAQGRLDAAFSASGKSVEDYRSQIDKLVAKNHEYAISEATTKSRLAELTLALGDPAKAIQELSTAQDIAAGTGRSYASSVDLLRRMNDGNVRAFAEAGVTVKDLAKAQRELTAAQAESSRTGDAVAKAQQSFNDKLAVYEQATTHTLAQQQSLYRSHQDLEKAEKAHAEATAKVTQAQKEARSAALSQAQGVQVVTDKYKGQQGGADGLLGTLHVLATKGRDDVASFAEKYGSTIGGLGLALQGIAGTTKLVRDAFTRMRDVEVATSADAATAVELNAARAEAAMAGEADVAEASAARINTAWKGILGSGVIVGAGLEIFKPWSKTGNEDPKVAASGFSSKQLDTVRKYITEQNYSGDAAANAGLTDKLLKQGKLSQADQQTLLDFLLQAGGKGKGYLSKVFDPNGLNPNALKNLGLNDANDYSKAFGSLIGDLTDALGAGGTGDGANPLLSDNPNIATRAQAAASSAGSKIGAAAGKATGDSFADFLKKYDLGAPVNAALAAAHDKAVAAAQKLVDDVSSKLDTAKSKLATDLASYRQEIATVAQTVTQGSSLTDALNGADSGARNPFGDRPGQGSGLHGVEGFLHTRAMMLARFAKALNDLRRRGLAPALIAEVANLGVDEGLRAADELLAGAAADIRTLNLEQQQINRAAGVIGTGIARQDYGSTLTSDREAVAALEKKLDQTNALLTRISRTPGTLNVNVNNSGASSQEIGREVGTRILQAMKGMG